MSFTQGLGKRSEEVLRILQFEIAQGSLPAGSRLPSEQQLCTRFHTSRNTIRRALARLLADGLVDARKRITPAASPAIAPLPAGKTLSMMFTLPTDGLIAVQNHALALGYLLCIYSRTTTGYDPAHERLFLQRVHEEHHRGVLACCTPLLPYNDDLLGAMDADGIRILHIEPYRLTPPVQNFILPDYRRAGYMAAMSLLLAGYQHLVYTGMSTDWPGAKLLLRGFAEALDDHHGGYDPARHYFEFPTNLGVLPDAQARLASFLHACQPQTAFLCRSIDQATHITGVLREKGRRVPEDYGVISMRNLTERTDTAEVDTLEFDRLAGLQRAIEVLTREEWPPLQDWLAPVLIRRDTTRLSVAL